MLRGRREVECERQQRSGDAQADDTGGGARQFQRPKLNRRLDLMCHKTDLRMTSRATGVKPPCTTVLMRSVFFYGLFMDVDVLRAKGVAPRRVRKAAAPGFALRLGARAEPSVSAYRPEAMLVQIDDGSWLAALCMTLPTPPGPDESNPEYARQLRALAQRLERRLRISRRRGSVTW